MKKLKIELCNHYRGKLLMIRCLYAERIGNFTCRNGYITSKGRIITRKRRNNSQVESRYRL